MGVVLGFLRAVGLAGGWLFLVWAVASMRRDAARQRALARNVVQAGASGGTLGLCPKCKRPKLPPGVKAPDYLSVCECPAPSAAAALEGRPPRPIT